MLLQDKIHQSRRQDWSRVCRENIFNRKSTLILILLGLCAVF